MNFSLEQLFHGQLMFPYFPLSLSELDAKISYHEIKHDDKFIDKLEKQAQKEFKESYAAYQGMELNL